jgi:hypothetical protein
MVKRRCRGRTTATDAPLLVGEAERRECAVSWQLWRQDDNGNRFLVGTFASIELAEQRAAELTKSLHKQMYWIVPDTLPDDFFPVSGR